MKAKKFLSILLSLVMAVTAFAAFAVNASAADINSLPSGTQKTISLPKKYSENGETYKITLNKSGKLNFTIISNIYSFAIEVRNLQDKKIRAEKVKDTLGTSEIYLSDETVCSWNSIEKKYKGTVTYSLDKGTYYVKMFKMNGSSYEVSDKVTFKVSYPSSDNSSDVKINNLTLTMKVGDKIQLGTALSASTDDNVAWKSSKTSVAKVSATGLVTAKAAGTATITATIGDSSQKIDIIVKK